MFEPVTNNPYRLLGVTTSDSAALRTANYQHLSATFVNSSSEVTCPNYPLDLTEWLGPLQRSAALVKWANATLSDPKSQVCHALFWFTRATKTDTAALESLSVGDTAGARMRWRDARRENSKSWSACVNGLVQALVENDLTEAALCCDRLCGRYSEQFVGAINAEAHLEGGELREQFLNLVEGADYRLLPRLCSASGTSLAWRMALKERLAAPLIDTCLGAVASAQRRINEAPEVHYEAALSLARTTEKPLSRLRSSLGVGHKHFRSLADKVADAVLSLAVAYYNDSRAPDRKERVRVLLEYALDTSVGPVTKSHCSETLRRISETDEVLPDQEIASDVHYIAKQVQQFNRQPSGTHYALELLETTRLSLEKIRNVLGADNAIYLKISSAVVMNALGDCIKEVNTAQQGMGSIGFDYEPLTSVINDAREALDRMVDFDMTNDCRLNFNENCRKLLSLQSQVEAAIKANELRAAMSQLASSGSGSESFEVGEFHTPDDDVQEAPSAINTWFVKNILYIVPLIIAIVGLVVLLRAFEMWH